MMSTRLRSSLVLTHPTWFQFSKFDGILWRALEFINFRFSVYVCHDTALIDWNHLFVVSTWYTQGSISLSLFKGKYVLPLVHCWRIFRWFLMADEPDFEKKKHIHLSPHLWYRIERMIPAWPISKIILLKLVLHRLPSICFDVSTAFAQQKRISQMRRFFYEWLHVVYWSLL